MKIRPTDGFAQEVVFDGTVKGEGLAICISDEDPTTTVQWILHVYVQLAQGWFLLGSGTTVAAISDVGAARVVGIASCPGARGWKVTFQPKTPIAASNTSLDAEATLQAGLCCGSGGVSGVLIPPTGGGGGT